MARPSSHAELEALGFSVELPAGAHWTVDPPVDPNVSKAYTFEAKDVGVGIDVLPIHALCKDVVTALVAGGDGKLERQTALIPASWFQQVVDSGMPDEADVLACADTPAGPMIASFSFDRAKRPAALRDVKALLAAIAKGARGLAPVGSLPSERTIHLPLNDLDVTLPNAGSAWMLTNRNAVDDVLTRVEPAGAPIEIIVRGNQNMPCNVKDPPPQALGPRFATGSDTTSGDERDIRGCATTPRGSIDINVVVPAKASAADLAEMSKVVDSLTSNAGARAPGEAAATQQMHLPVLDLDVPIPAPGVKWTLGPPHIYEGRAIGADELRRTVPGFPFLSLSFEYADTDCSDLVEHKLSNDRVEHPDYVPADWYSAARQESNQSHLAATACFPGSRPVKAFIYLGIPYGSKGPPADQVALIKSVLSAVSTAARASAPAVTGAEVEEMKLPVLGFPVTVKQGDTRWSTSELVIDSGQHADLIQRIRPMVPLLNVRVFKDTGSCRELAPSGHDAVAVQHPAYLPDDWNGNTFVILKPNDSIVLGCMDVDGGLIDLQIVYGGALDSADFATVTPMLAEIARRAKAAFVAAPAATPTASAPATSSPPPSGAGGGFGPAHVEAVGFLLTPKDSRIAKNYGADLAIEGAVPTDFDDTVDLAGEYRASLGYDNGGNLGYDLDGGLGIGVHFGPVTLAPIVGVGIESRSGGGDDRFKLPFAPFYYIEGRLRVRLGEKLAIEGSAARVKRTDNTTTVQIDKTTATVGVTDETRAVGRLVLVGDSGTETALGFHFADYQAAKLMGVSIGRSF